MFIPAVGKCSFHPLWVRSSGIFSPASSNLAMFAQTVGFNWSCVRSTASLFRQAARPFHVLSGAAPPHALPRAALDWSPSSIHIPSSARCACRGFVSRARLLWVVTAELSRLCLLFQLHFVVVYSAVLADSPSGTSDTTAWSSVRVGALAFRSRNFTTTRSAV